MRTVRSRKPSDKIWTDEAVKVYKRLYDEYKTTYGKNPNVVALSIINLAVSRVEKGEECHWDETYPGKLVWSEK